MAIGHERVIEPELLDHASPDVARDNLRDLVRINRYLGGHAILRRIMANFVLSREDRFSMLDVGAASGDMGAVLRRCYPRATVTSLDRKCVHLEKAEHPKLAADAFLLPFAPRSFDFVFSSLFLHHFTDDQVVDLFHNFRTLARRAVIAIDLDRFKQINDEYGHAVGDQILRVFGEQLKRATRGSDVAARFGGDEFLAILPDCNSEQIRHVFSRLNGILVTTTKSKIVIRYSAGWTDYIRGESLDDFLKRADDMLYANKHNQADLHVSPTFTEEVATKDAFDRRANQTPEVRGTNSRWS